jgi:hypothetical protein
MTTDQSQQNFVLLLDRALRDERWRAFISAQVRQHELPVIELDAGRSRRSGTAALGQRPR